MSISSISQPAQQLAAQQTALAASGEPGSGFEPETGTASAAASAGASLSRGGTASLSSQTLQALLGLTQNDPASQASTLASPLGTHRHHPHHGGGAGQQALAQTAPTNTSNDPTVSSAQTDSSSDDSDSLATALGA
jgi:hypothetical protein